MKKREELCDSEVCFRFTTITIRKLHLPPHKVAHYFVTHMRNGRLRIIFTLIIICCSYATETLPIMNNHAASLFYKLLWIYTVDVCLGVHFDIADGLTRNKIS
uniref:Uncharacterized protein n=1 Tax=Glossina pallidipes TaxID=7398 RepID=A0A1A9ZH96_GLOPL